MTYSVGQAATPTITICRETPEPDNRDGDIPDYERITLLASKHCANCKMVGMMLKDAGIPFDELFVENDIDKFSNLGLTSVPALYIPSEKKFYSNIGEIESIISSMVH